MQGSVDGVNGRSAVCFVFVGLNVRTIGSKRFQTKAGAPKHVPYEKCVETYTGNSFYRLFFPDLLASV